MSSPSLHNIVICHESDCLVYVLLVIESKRNGSALIHKYPMIQHSKRLCQGIFVLVLDHYYLLVLLVVTVAELKFPVAVGLGKFEI